MKFPYKGHVGIDPISGEGQFVTRPEIPLVVHGPSGSAAQLGLVDTGADYTLVPSKLAVLLGIETQPTVGANAEAFGGQQLQTTFGDVVFELECDGRILRWLTTVLFHDFENDTILLGHVGFLHYFSATFDGVAMELTLIPAEDIPLLP